MDASNSTMQSFPSGGKSICLHAVTPPDIIQRRPAVVLLHGAGGNIGFWLDRIAPFISLAGVAIFAPSYFERTGTTRADPETILDGRHVPLWLETIADALTHITAQPNVDPSRIALLGISLGAFLAIALAAQTPDLRKLRAIVEISGGLPGPYAPTVLTSDFPPTLILHGEADTVVPVSEAYKLDRALTDARVPHQNHIFPGEGHWFSLGAQGAILRDAAIFLAQHLTPHSPQNLAGATR